MNRSFLPKLLYGTSELAFPESSDLLQDVIRN